MNNDLDSERIGLAEHLPKLTTAKKTNCAIHVAMVGWKILGNPLDSVVGA
jgi:hypothetical protein